MAEKLPSQTHSCLAFVQKDFSLQMVDTEGNHIEMEEYLDYSLKNLRDRKVINTLKQTFKETHQNFSGFSSSINGLTSYIFPCPEEKTKY